MPEVYKTCFLSVKWEQKRTKLIIIITSTNVCVIVVFLGLCSGGPGRAVLLENFREKVK